jgi:hypothetical protein
LAGSNTKDNWKALDSLKVRVDIKFAELPRVASRQKKSNMKSDSFVARVNKPLKQITVSTGKALTTSFDTELK